MYKCPICQSDLRFIDDHGQWWCDNCRVYNPQPIQTLPKPNSKSRMVKVVGTILILILIFGPILYFLNSEWDYYKSEDPPYVNYIEYHARYDTSLDLQQIRFVLEANNVSIINSAGYLECNYGHTFNNLSISDTHCLISGYGQLYNDAYVTIRLYEADEVSSIFNRVDMDIYKPDLEISMNYITNLIENATGEEPTDLFWYYEDGSDLDYPGI